MLTAEQYLLPDVARRVARLDLKAKFIVEGFLAGLHDSPYRGFSMEFSEHRRYTPGDDPQDLDWTAWARTDRLYLRTYKAETNLAAYLLVDTSRSMAYAGPGGAVTKLEYATSLAAALGYLLVRQGDAVGLGLVGSGLNRFVRPRGGRRQLVRVLADLCAPAARGLPAWPRAWRPWAGASSGAASWSSSRTWWTTWNRSARPWRPWRTAGTILSYFRFSMRPSGTWPRAARSSWRTPRLTAALRPTPTRSARRTAAAWASSSAGASGPCAHPAATSPR